MMKRFLNKTGSIFLILMLFTVQVVLSQKVAVNGTVKDVNNNGMPGVNVVVAGTTNGVVTDVDGNFSINTEANATLNFTFIGYVSQALALEGKTNVSVTLLEDVTRMDEVVVVGYGTQRKSDLTGAVAVVKTENLEKVQSNDITKMLQGQVSGVTVHSSGEPGAVPIVKIRGVGSFQNTGPLYVIDGIPVEGIADFSPTDIESMQVLKDASACAIYGSRGANGVIIITTKKGKSGRVRVDYDGTYSIHTMAKRMDVTKREDFQKLNNKAKENDGLSLAPANDTSNIRFIGNIDTDWQKEALKNGYTNEHTLRISGGKDIYNYSLNLNYYDQEGQLVGNGPSYERYSAKLNTEQKFWKIKTGQSLYFARSNKVNLTNSQWGNTALMDIISAIPTVPIYDTTNIGGFGGGVDTIHNQIAGNSIGYNSLKNFYEDRDRFLGNIWAEYEFITGLTYKINLSYDEQKSFRHEYTPRFNLGTRITNAQNELKEWDVSNPVMLMEHTLNYNKELGKHKFSLLAGYSAQKEYWDIDYGTAVGDSLAISQELSFGKNAAYEYTRPEHTMISYLGRFNYSYDDKYLLTANFRRDASSRFGPNKKWGNFPSVSVAWKLNNEPFLKSIDIITLLKLRGGIGTIGNEKIGEYGFESVINPYASYVFNGKLNTGMIQTIVADPSIHWEEKETRNVGIDVALFKNRLEFSAEYYYNIARDLLYEAPIPWSVGSVKPPFTNIGTMVNKGFEASLTFRKMEGDFHFDISINATTLENEVTKLGKTLTTYMSRTEVGQPMGQLYGWDFIGIFQTKDEINTKAPGAKGYDPNKHAYQTGAKPGDAKFRDVNNDSLINDDDRIYLGTAIPWLTGGLNVNMEYKGIDFSFFFQGVYGNKAFNGPYQILHSYGLGNYSPDLLTQQWTGPGSTNEYPRMTQLDQNGNNRTSQRFIEDASYLKLQSLQIGYTFPVSLIKSIKAEKVRVFISGQNLLTFTKYRGFDPDFSNDGLFYRGQDYGSFPTPRTYMAGIKLSF